MNVGVVVVGLVVAVVVLDVVAVVVLLAVCVVDSVVVPVEVAEVVAVLETLLVMVAVAVVVRLEVPVDDALAVAVVVADVVADVVALEVIVADTVVVPVDVPVATASQVTLRSFISGHGFGGNENCAEFCSKEHSYSLGDGSWDREVWREGCEDTVTDGTQQGTWKYDRAGWCPGAQVFPWDMDATDSWSGDSVSVGYDVEDYTWNGSEGQPYFYMSGVLLVSE